MKTLIARLRWRRSDEDAQGLAEYALILALVALAAVGGLTLLGSTIANSQIWNMFD